MNNYPYANGVIKSLENNILDRNKLYKLITVDTKDFVQTLGEMEYGSDCKDLETLISSEIQEVKKTIFNLSPNEVLTNLFFLSFDVQNIKVLYKIKYFDSCMKENNINEMLVKTGAITPTSLKKAILEDDFNGLDKVTTKLITMINKSLTIQQKSNARLLSSFLDNSIYQYALNNCKQNKSVETYFKALIDFTNVITYIRSHNLNWPIDRFEEMLLDGGTIKKTFFYNNYEDFNDAKHQEQVLKNYSIYYQEKITKIIKIYLEKKNLNRLEKDFDSLLIEIMKQYQNDAFDVGPMIYYYLEKMAEAKNIRMLYANKSLELNDLIEY